MLQCMEEEKVGIHLVFIVVSSLSSFQIGCSSQSRTNCAAWATAEKTAVAISKVCSSYLVVIDSFDALEFHFESNLFKSDDIR